MNFKLCCSTLFIIKDISVKLQVFLITVILVESISHFLVTSHLLLASMLSIGVSLPCHIVVYTRSHCRVILYTVSYPVFFLLFIVAHILRSSPTILNTSTFHELQLIYHLLWEKFISIEKTIEIRLTVSVYIAYK